MRILISKCGIYTSQGKRVLLATRAVVNGRKAVAYVKNGQLQGYEYDAVYEPQAEAVSETDPSQAEEEPQG